MEAFFIFNRIIGSDDETATIAERIEKILFYQSTSDDLEVQLERLSLCEAFIDLCRSLHTEVPCDAIFMDNHNYIMIEPEPDTWMVLVMSVDNTCVTPTPSRQMRRRSFSKSTFRKAKEPESGDLSSKYVNRTMEYETPSVRALSSVLWRLARAFTVLNGRIADMLWPPNDTQDIPGTIKKLRHLLRKSRELQQLSDEGDLMPSNTQTGLLEGRIDNEDKLAEVLARSTAEKVRKQLEEYVPMLFDSIDINGLHMLYSVDAMPFLAIDKSIFLGVQSTAMKLRIRFPCIKYCVTLYRNQMLWSSLSISAFLPVYYYLEAYLATNTPHIPGYYALGKSKLGDHSKAQDSANAYIPFVYLESETKPLRIAVYALDPQITIVMFFEDELIHGGAPQDSSTHLVSLCGEVEAHLVAEFASIAELLTENENASTSKSGNSEPNSSTLSRPRLLSYNTKASTTETGERFIYINEMNSLVNISQAWYIDSTEARKGIRHFAKDLGPNMLRVLNTIRRAFEENTHLQVMEIIESVECPIKNPYASCWIAALKSGSRQVYLVVNSKQSLESVSQKLRSLCESSFHSILL